MARGIVEYSTTAEPLVIFLEINSEFSLLNANLVVSADCRFIFDTATIILNGPWGYRNEETCHVAEFTVRSGSGRNRRASCLDDRCDG
jgi:hypothetical protein